MFFFLFKRSTDICTQSKSICPFVPDQGSLVAIVRYNSLLPHFISGQMFENVTTKWTSSVKQFFSAKVAIINLRVQSLLFFSFPPFLLLAIFFFFPFSSILWFSSFWGAKNPVFWPFLHDYKFRLVRFQKIGYTSYRIKLWTRKYILFWKVRCPTPQCNSLLGGGWHFSFPRKYVTNPMRSSGRAKRRKLASSLLVWFLERTRILFFSGGTCKDEALSDF